MEDKGRVILIDLGLTPRCLFLEGQSIWETFWSAFGEVSGRAPGECLEEVFLILGFLRDLIILAFFLFFHGFWRFGSWI